MIRSALIALGLSAGGLGAGTATAQGMVPMAPALQVCGGTRLVLDADDATDIVDLNFAAEIVSRRVGKFYTQPVDFTHLVGEQIVVSLPVPLIPDVEALAPLFQYTEFKFLDVMAEVPSGDEVTLEDGQVLLPFKQYPELNVVADSAPILDANDVAAADVIYDQAGNPMVSFQFTPEGSDIFGRHTADHIGGSIAIVLRGQVVSAPVIQSPILGGRGQITGGLTNREAVELAAVLQGGVLPFDLSIVAQEVMDGSDPSADFCP